MPKAAKTAADPGATVVAVETKNEKFRRLATARLAKAIAAVAALGGLASKAYEFSGAEVVALMKPLENEVIKVGTKLNTFISSPVASKAAAAAFDPFAVLDQVAEKQPEIEQEKQPEPQA